MLNTIVDIKNRQASGYSEPVTLQEAKDWAIITHTDDDTLLTAMIYKARVQVENKARLSLVQRDIILTVDLVREFKLPYGPVRSISEVLWRQGTNADGTPDNVTLTTEDYTTDGLDFIVIKSSKSGRHKITYVAGYETTAGVNCPIPEDLRSAVLAQVAFLYEHRGDANMSGKFSDEAEAFLQPYKSYAHI